MLVSLYEPIILSDTDPHFGTDSKKKEPSPMLSPIWISEELQPWPERSSVRFKTIGALYSEFIALSEGGDLYQWRWADAEPYKSEVIIKHS